MQPINLIDFCFKLQPQSYLFPESLLGGTVLIKKNSFLIFEIDVLLSQSFYFLIDLYIFLFIKFFILFNYLLLSR
jgi:hypothetical protein